MAKEIISYDELLEKIQKLVSSCVECSDIHIDAIQTYPQDVDGANWNITSMRRSGDDNDLVACKEVITESILNLRQNYNVETK